MNVSRGRSAKWISFGVLPLGALVFGFLVHQSRSQMIHGSLPFTAHYSETSTNTLTGRVVQMPLLYMAVRSDGTTSSGSLNQRTGYRRIRSRQAKKEVTVNDFLKLKTTLDYGYIPFTPPRRTMPADCRPHGSEFSSLGVEMIGDYRAYRYQFMTVLTDGSKREYTQWLAPDLGCWEIQQTTRGYDSRGVLDGLFEKKVVEITPGEPDDALFAVPDAYVEVKPSEREKALHLQNVTDREGSERATKREIPLSIETRWAQADERYEAVANKRWQPPSPAKR
jgi:hypothetical protein